MMQINLIPDELRYRFPLKPVLLGVVLFFLLGANCLVINTRQEALNMLKLELAQKQNHLEKLEQTITAVKMEEFQQTSEKLNRMTTAKNQIALRKRSYWQDIFTISGLAGAVDETVLHKIELNREKNYLTIQVAVSSLGIGADYLTQVRRQGRFREVVLLKGDRTPLSDSTMLEVLVLLEAKND